MAFLNQCCVDNSAVKASASIQDSARQSLLLPSHRTHPAPHTTPATQDNEVLGLVYALHDGRFFIDLTRLYRSTGGQVIYPAPQGAVGSRYYDWVKRWLLAMVTASSIPLSEVACAFFSLFIASDVVGIHRGCVSWVGRFECGRVGRGV